ncbi:MAG TPA: LacI family DNA-binding transcriptional regulator [Anaerohalosphaeraceae bacterium]|nr:LacI family DNA-binding transcriptional regulator [Anaerohalosphaeraceae bacterium]
MAHLSNQKTIKSLAEHMGLSRTTVSRVLSGQAKRYRIGSETEEAVIAEAARLEIVPNKTAKSLKLQRTYSLGLIVPNIANPFFGTLARYIEAEARKEGYTILLCDSGESEMMEIELLGLLNSNNVDGVIAAPIGLAGSHFKELHKQGKPVVIVDRYFSNIDLPFVTSDNYQASYEATEYLITNGHRIIACIQGFPGCGLTVDRVRGYKDALKAYGIPEDNTLIVGNQFDQHRGYIETKLLMKRNPRPTAIFSLGSSMAFGALSAILEENLKVPEDISLISFDEQPYFAYLATPLTAIAQENATMGEIAVKLLIDQIESKNDFANKSILLPTKFNIRKSVKNIS